MLAASAFPVRVDCATATSEFLYGWFFSPYPLTDARLNAIGTCFDRAGRLYDADGDGTAETPVPSCTTLPDTDTDGDGRAQHLENGCAPAP